jgi:hypothetical protein
MQRAREIFPRVFYFLHSMKKIALQLSHLSGVKRLLHVARTGTPVLRVTT